MNLYEVIKVSAQMLRATGGWTFEQRETSGLNKLQKEVILEKKLSYEYVSLRGKIEDLMEMSNGDIDNLFTF